MKGNFYKKTTVFSGYARGDILDICTPKTKRKVKRIENKGYRRHNKKICKSYRSSEFS